MTCDLESSCRRDQLEDSALMVAPVATAMGQGLMDHNKSSSTRSVSENAASAQHGRHRVDGSLLWTP